MSDRNLIQGRYDSKVGICEGAESMSKGPEAAAPKAPGKVFFMASAKSALPQISQFSSSILTRRYDGDTLSAAHARIDALTSQVSAELSSPANVALAFAGPALLGKVGRLSSLALTEVGAFTSLGLKPVASRLGLAALPALLAACGSNSDVDYTNPGTADASPPPASSDPSCESLYDKINGTTSDASLKTLVQGIQFPTLDVTYHDEQGNKYEVLNDSFGNPISEITPNTPVAWVKKGDKLFVLTSNKIGSDYAPATLFVYALNADNTLISSEPLPTADLNGKAVLFTNFGPTNMALTTLENGSQWLGLSFGALEANKIIMVDPSGPYNPYNPAKLPDYCAISGYPQVDGGAVDASYGDSSSPDAGTQSDASVDGGNG